MEDITFTIDGVSYGISYALYDLIGTEEHSGTHAGSVCGRGGLGRILLGATEIT